MSLAALLKRDSVMEDSRRMPEWWCCWQVGVDVMLEASQEHVFEKSAALCELFITLMEQECSRWEVQSMACVWSLMCHESLKQMLDQSIFLYANVTM